MPTKNELAKIKKQAALIARSKGTTVDEIMYDSLKTYVSENMDWVLENFAKMQDKKKQESEPNKSILREKNGVSNESSSQSY